MKGHFVLGLVVCWTVLCTGVQGLDKAIDEDAWPPDVEDNILRLLKDEDFIVQAADEGECETEAECGFLSPCEGEVDKKICVCKPGLSGDRCFTIDECETGKFVECKNGKGTCRFINDKAVCQCEKNQKFDTTTNTCKECACGVNEKCSYDDGKKKCECIAKHLEKTDGSCSPCDCGPNGKCIFSPSDEKQCECHKGFADKSGVCTACVCGENQKCSFVNGVQKCDCVAEYAKKKDRICYPCDCGSKGECSFSPNDEKQCKCIDGFADKSGVCTECVCKDNEKCFYENGEKTCDCVAEYAKKKDGICHRCVCGLNEECSFSPNDEMMCKCYAGYANKNFICTEMCDDNADCGYGSLCEEENESMKFCKCKPGLSGDKCFTIDECEFGIFKDCKGYKGNCTYSNEKAVCQCKDNKKLDSTVKYCKVCNCGDKGECSFENGNKKCVCEDKHAEKEDGLCHPCDCGVNGTCSFENGDKKCKCDPKHLEKEDGICHLCDCGVSGTCTFTSNGEKECVCVTGFKVKDGKCTATCSDDKECGYNSLCEEAGANDFCDCLPGLSGDKCLTIDECETGTFNNCRGDSGKCRYRNGVVDCQCNDKKQQTLDTKTNTCKVCDCGEKGTCSFENGKKKCVCNDNFAEKKDGICHSCDCGSNGKCAFNPKDEKMCNCNDGFADKNGTCAATCDDDKDCGYGSPCKGDEKKKLCECKIGLSGDKCLTIDACGKDEFKNCKGDNGTCSYLKDKAVCQCKDNKKLDSTSNTCKDCVCGEKEECSFENGKEKCECATKHARKKDNKCYSCGCGDKVISCEFTADDKKVCKCDPGYNEKDGVCNECDCGKSGTCEFKDGKKTCNCEINFAEKNGKCIATCSAETDCGHGSPCKGEGDKKLCDCKPGLSGEKCFIIDECVTGKFKDCKDDKGSCIYKNTKAECECKPKQKLDVKSNTCKGCDCGDNGDCSIEDGKKKCNCDPKYSEKKDGKCYFCDCGEKGSCKFTDDNKVCDCNPGFADNDGVCKACTCGTNSDKCEFVNKVQTCTCKAGFEQKKLICEECKCGDYSEKCGFDENGNQTCICKSDFSQKGKTCEECKCGTNSKDCSFNPEGKQICDCKPDFSQKENSCEACDCGKKGTCSFQAGKKTCKCEKGHSENVKDGKCYECDCGDAGTCTFLENNKTACDCNPYHEHYNGTCIECDCRPGTCSLKEGKKECLCSGGYALRTVNGKSGCHEICEPTDASHCKHKSPCLKIEGNNFCQCLVGLAGDRCENITECTIGKYKACELSGGKCVFDTTAPCKCVNPKVLDPERYFCRKSCAANSDCKNGAKCNAVCQCNEGTSGDDCSTVDKCAGKLEDQCQHQNAKCTFDQNTLEATCTCNDKNFEYVGEKCVPKWCNRNICKDDISTCEFSDGTGYCKCKQEGQYYDYKENACKDTDKCLLVTKCTAEEICKDGQCNCRPGYFRAEKDKPCTRTKACNANSCFKEAKCEESDLPGVVKCLCQTETSFYNARGECADGSCFMPKFKKNCNASCPVGMKRIAESGECEPNKDDNKCKEEKKCGLGWCYWRNGKDECQCETYAKKEGEICVLNAEVVCPQKKTLKEDATKCNCTHPFKTAANGITCEKKMCADKGVQEECNSKRATCVDNWKRVDKSYECGCAMGYTMTDDGCTDECSTTEMKLGCSYDDQICFTGKNGKPMCRCPPSFTDKKIGNRYTCQAGGENTFMILDLPIIGGKYVQAGNTVDIATLSTDVIESMNQLYNHLEFAQVYSYRLSDKNVIICDVWLQFREHTTIGDAKRWKSHIVKKEHADILPPLLLLSSEDLEKVKTETAEICSDRVTQSLCGAGAVCKDNTCSCKSGYRILEFTIKKFEKSTILRCADVDECAEGKHTCPNTTTCVNTDGSYKCNCIAGYHKKDGSVDAGDREPCTDFCTPNPCKKGGCSIIKETNSFDCSCQPGYGGSLCHRADPNFKKAMQNTTVVGAVLGTLLAVAIILFVVYILRQKKSAYSEDFTPAPRVDNAEMTERRPMRGVSNRAYQ